MTSSNIFDFFEIKPGFLGSRENRVFYCEEKL